MVATNGGSLGMAGGAGKGAGAAVGVGWANAPYLGVKKTHVATNTRRTDFDMEDFMLSEKFKLAPLLAGRHL